ncbi:hypothetical protein [Brevundimonas sp. Root1279]|uniref:hypothetical protein n=1 Tax=Brevundimonas sp. Root1279 TaxID=1736443 RepID=UPI0012E3E363|nr:hypothetical protein [Brevundimonas sp. Root1279]
MMLLAACQRPAEAVEPNPVPPGYVASLTSVQAEQCGERCRFVVLDISVENRDDRALCVPGVYGGDSANGALVFTYDGAEEVVTTSEPYDPNPFLSPDPAESMKGLVAHPSYVVPAGQRRELRVVLENKFDLQRRAAKATLRFSAFACDAAGSDDGALSVVDLDQRVTFAP